MTVLERLVLGRTLRAQGSVELTDWLGSIWPAVDAQAVGSAAGHVTLEHCPQSVAAETWPEQATRSVVLRDVQVDTAEEDGVVWLGDRHRGARLDASRPPHVRIQVWGDIAEHPDLLLAALIEALRSTGLLPFHAAVAARGGRATAFLGPSGRGKTSTLLTALDAGWTPVAEDLAFFDPLSGFIHGCEAGLSLLPDTFERVLPRLPADASAPLSFGKRLVPFSLLHSAPAAAELAQIAVLERDARHSSGWQFLEAWQAARAMWEATGLPLQRQNRIMTAQMIGRVVQNLPCHRMLLGADGPQLERHA